MCGICGFIRKENSLPASNLLRMNQAIRHRGPDDEGYFCIEQGKGQSYSGEDSLPEIQQNMSRLTGDIQLRIGMGFRRLSIIDLSAAGHQPMLSEDKKVAVTFNGAIYNFSEIRKELQDKGYTFRSSTDTEVIQKGYMCWGKDIVNRLNGMFAFVIADLHKQKLWMVRDRMGIKPLFYHIADDGITWASEIKALLCVEDVPAALHMPGQIGNYYLQSTPPPATCFRDIFSLMPATWMEIDMNTCAMNSFEYWKIPLGKTGERITLEEAGEELTHRLNKIISAQLYADVPLITMMSGGIDSTTVTAIASDLTSGLHCYSMGYDGTGNGTDELPQAKLMADKLGIQQHIHILENEEHVVLLDTGLRIFEEPYTGPEVNLNASWFIAANGFKVVLSGNGADELFGGYAHILGIESWKKRRKWSFLSHLIPGKEGYRAKLKNYLGIRNAMQYYAQSRTSMRPYEIKSLLLPEYAMLVDETLRGLQYPDEQPRFRNEYEALFYYDLRFSVSGHHVFRDDLSSMKFGLEMRYPYLDHTLIEWVAGLPFDIRYNGHINKPLLRTAAARYIEPDNLKMPKKGFNLPVEEWWKNNGAMKSYMDKQLNRLKKRDIFNNHTISKWQQNAHTFFDLAKIWQLVTTEVWMQTYLD